MPSAYGCIESAASWLEEELVSIRDLTRLHHALQLFISGTILGNGCAHSCSQDIKRLPFRRALMTIQAVAGRRSEEPGTPVDHQRLYHLIRSNSEQILGSNLIIARSKEPGLWLGTSRTLVRMDSLQVYPRIIARQTMEAVSSVGAHGEKDLLTTCSGAAEMLRSLVPQTSVPSANTPQSAYADEFYTALAASNLMEHVARACLKVILRNSQGQNAHAAAAVIGRLVYINDSLCTALCEEGAPEPRLAHLRAALSGRCLQHLVSSQLVSTLCAVDGGLSYGLPIALLRGLPVLTVKRCPLQTVRNTTQRDVVSPLLFTPLGVLGRQLPSRLRPAAVLQLQLRAARMALGSMPPVQGEQRLVLSETEAQGVACRMLLAARGILNGALASREHAAEHVAWWQELVRFLDSATGEADGDTQCIELMLSSLVEAEADRLQEAAPMALSAALSAGILPCLERALRRAGVPPSAPHWFEPPATVAVCMCLGEPVVWGRFWAYMAYGDPRQAVSLVATLGKLLRRLTSNGLGAFGEAARHRADLVLEPIVNASSNAPLQLFNRLIRTVTNGHGGSLLMTGPSRQALAVLSYALVCWLPPLSELALAGSPSGPHSRTVAAHATALDPPRGGCLAAILFILPILLPSGAPGQQQDGYGDGAVSSALPAAAAEPEQESGGGRSVDPCAATTQAEQEGACMLVAPQIPSPAAAVAAASPPPGGGGWRPWLLREARAMEVVGAALAGLEEGEEMQDAAHSDLGLCCVSAFRDEARAAVAAELTGSAPAGRASERSVCERGGSAALGAGIVDKLRKLQGKLVRDGWVAHEVRALLEGSMKPGPDDTGCQRQYEGCEDGVLRHIQRIWWAVNRLLPPPEQLPALLPLPPACANPRCASLAGDSEAGVRLQACQRCSAARYCCRECQVAHWRAGHKEACGRQQRTG